LLVLFIPFSDEPAVFHGGTGDVLNQHTLGDNNVCVFLGFFVISNFLTHQGGHVGWEIIVNPHGCVFPGFFKINHCWQWFYIDNDVIKSVFGDIP